MYGHEDFKRIQNFIKGIKLNLILIKVDGSFQLNLQYFKFTYTDKICNYKKWAELFGLENESLILK